MKRLSRGQAGVIGGIVIIAILFSIALPLILQYQRSGQKVVEGSTKKAELMEKRIDEILTVRGIPITQETLLSGLAPGFWVNNTGSIPVSIKRIWLTYSNGTIYAIIDMADPLQSGIIESITINPGTPYAYTISSTDQGTLPVLQPGDSMHVKLKPLPDLDQIYIHVESGLGVMHPRIGEGQPLVPQATGGGTSGGTGGTWKGIYMPISGIKLVGYKELMASGRVEAWTPPIRVYSEQYTWFGLTLEPSTFSYSESFIFDDPQYPGLYMIRVKASSSFYVHYYNYETGEEDDVPISSGEYVCIRGFVGTYDVDYFSGWAFEIDVGTSPSCGNPIVKGTSKRNVTALGINIYDGGLDYDGNGVDELVMFSHLNGPLVTELDTDADSEGGPQPDALVWEYMVSRDISNSDFIKVTGKVNYYWTATYYGSCPSTFRHLKIFAVVIYEYVNGSWIISQYKDYEYTSEKPRQYNFEAVFPVNRTGIYRVGILFYDNYRDFDGEGYSCYIDFTYTLEHLLVEYGVNNPFFTETPAVYILAINGYPTDSIGTYDNVTELANLVEQYLESMGISSYVLVDTPQKYEDLLIDNPPKNAIIINLHGSVIPVISGMDITDIHNLIAQNGWIWVSVADKPAANYSDGTQTIPDPQGLSELLGVASVDVNIYDSPNDTANITSVGRYVRSLFLAAVLPDTTTMRWQVTVNYNTTFFNQTCVFYQNNTGMPLSLSFIGGASGLGNGAVVINGFDRPQTTQDLNNIAAFATYFSVYVWGVINSQVENVCSTS